MRANRRRETCRPATVRGRWVWCLPVTLTYALYTLAAITGSCAGWAIGQAVQAAILGG